MKRVVLLGSVLLLLGMSTLVAAQAPKPGPEAAKLAVWVGEWRYEGEAQATPLGPAAKISGRQTGRLITNGFGVEWTGEETGPFGGVQWGEIDVYDPVAKNYSYLGCQTDGTIWSGAIVASGNRWTYSGTITAKATTYKLRQDSSFSADGKTWTWKNEISADGKTWIPWVQGKMTKP